MIELIFAIALAQPQPKAPPPGRPLWEKPPQGHKPHWYNPKPNPGYHHKHSHKFRHGHYYHGHRHHHWSHHYWDHRYSTYLYYDPGIKVYYYWYPAHYRYYPVTYLPKGGHYDHDYDSDPRPPKAPSPVDED